VLIPLANVKHLMLREDVVEAVEDEQFRVWAVDRIDQALELFTGMPAGERDESGQFPEGSVNRKVHDRLVELADHRRSFSKQKGDEEKQG
jgi:predicted ATP-dependent protease